MSFDSSIGQRGQWRLKHNVEWRTLRAYSIAYLSVTSRRRSVLDPRGVILIDRRIVEIRTLKQSRSPLQVFQSFLPYLCTLGVNGIIEL